jgi:hypothetical protein
LEVNIFYVRRNYLQAKDLEPMTYDQNRDSDLNEDFMFLFFSGSNSGSGIKPVLLVFVLVPKLQKQFFRRIFMFFFLVLILVLVLKSALLILKREVFIV